MLRPWTLLAAALLCAAGEIATGSREALGRGGEALQARRLSDAENLYRNALEGARSGGDVWAEAEALRGLGIVHNGLGRFAEARTALTLSVKLHQVQTKDELNLARARNNLGYAEWGLGNRREAILLYESALAGFERAGERRERAALLYNLVFLSAPSERGGRLEAALRAAEEAGDRRLTGKCLHLWGDTLYTLGDARGAIGKLGQALPMLDAPHDRADRARVYLSLGRLYAVHRKTDAAVTYFERALAVQRETGDRQGVAYSLNSLGAAHQHAGKRSDADRLFRQALETARAVGSPSLVAAVLGSLGALQIEQKEYAGAMETLRESIRLNTDLTGRKYALLAAAHLGLGQSGAALEAADKAVEYGVKSGAADVRANALQSRAEALDGLRRGEEALAALRESLELREKLRASVLPVDSLKRGYGEYRRDAYDRAVDLLFRLGRQDEALVTAEQARSRAFLDLLANQSLENAAADPAEVVSADGEPYLASFASAPAPTLGSVQLAARNAGTLLVYWVAPKAVFIWLVTSGGTVRSARVGIDSVGLERLVLAAGAGTRDGVGGAQARRELYRLLILPVARDLPANPGPGVMIVPHGPLHRLSFGGLVDRENRYLLERYVLRYAPSAGATAGERSPRDRVKSFLLVADPDLTPPGPDGTRLPKLPGTRREVSEIARVVPQRLTTTLQGTRVTEPGVRQRLAGQRVIHFATHAIVADDRPFESYLALGGGSGADPDDGRLTVREIYALRLEADLVVLSGCQTARGTVTGDGILGLTRAFFYAGAGSLVATLWEVADEPTRALMARFYHHYALGRPGPEALRSAQLEVLATLRKGALSVATSAGEVTLPEHPVFWAGFVWLGRS